MDLAEEHIKVHDMFWLTNDQPAPPWTPHQQPQCHCQEKQGNLVSPEIADITFLSWEYVFILNFKFKCEKLFPSPT